MPVSPKPRQRPWLPKQESKHQGRAERSKEYNTARWQRVRNAHKQANPLCVECKKEGKVTVATVVDHIKPVRQGGSFYDPENHQSLCDHHHAVKSANERHGK